MGAAMPLLLTEQDVRALLDMPAAIGAVEESLLRQAAGDGWTHPRRRLALPERVFLNYMFAADQRGKALLRRAWRCSLYGAALSRR
jgi:ornithine cyclodeaminase/alanine dehydrogenase-like protein (mu-crystallin family)